MEVTLEANGLIRTVAALIADERGRVVFALLACVLVSSAWAQSPDEVVERYMSAYNDHDVEAMIELVHPDIQWLSIDGDRISVETDGAAALAEAMRGYFEAVPSTRSSIETMMVSGNRVSVRERAHWTSSGQTQSQAALSVYEIAEGRILRVWYFSAE